MGPMILALLLTISTVTTRSTIPPSDKELCTKCEATACGEGEAECHLQCSMQCPVGYSQSLITGGSCDDITTVASTVPTTTQLPQTTSDGSTLSTRSIIGILSSPMFDCWKCGVVNCSRCPPDDRTTNCTECVDGYRLEMVDLDLELVGTSNAGDSLTASRVAKCVWVNPGGGGGGGGDSGGAEDEDDGSSGNAGAIAGGVVAGGVVLLVVVAVAVVLLWRRNKARSGNEVMLSMMKQKKEKKLPDPDDDERSDSRYTKSPVASMRDSPSLGNEISEVNKLPQAPGVPQSPGTNGIYDAIQRQGSVAHAYGHLEFKEGAYKNESVIHQASGNEESVYNNTNAAAVSTAVIHEEDGPKETYENLGRGDAGEQQVYLDMSGGRGQTDPHDVDDQQEVGFTQDDIYINDQPPSRPAPGPPLTQDDVYLNEGVAPPTEDDVYLNEGVAPPTEDDVYLNEGVAPLATPLTQDDVYLNEAHIEPKYPDTQDELYLNQGELIEENIYQNT